MTAFEFIRDLRGPTTLLALLSSGAAIPTAPLWAKTSSANPSPTATCESKQQQARPWLDKTQSPECRARLVLADLGGTTEKLDALMDDPQGKWLTSRGLPVLSGSDGPAGPTRGGRATTFPAPLGMAASFDPEVASRYGDLLGREFRAAGLSRMGGPALDIARTWNFGRVAESMGEDPFLVSTMAAEEVAAVQRHGVLSMVKHFAVYTQEQGRAGDHPIRTKSAVNAVVSERAIREIYLPGFEGAIVRGRAGQVMCSFPRINGTYACENPYTLGILKKEWGFDGTVVPDFPDAQRSIIAAVNAGLDVGVFAGVKPEAANERSSPLATTADNGFAGENLREAVASGKISAARIDDLILRRLVPDFRVGAFDAPPLAGGEDVSTPADRAGASDIVAAGSVLLKNAAHILPLGPDVRSLAVIGTQAGAEPTVALLGSAHVVPRHIEPAITAIRARAGGVAKVTYAAGTLGLKRLPQVPVSMLRSPEGLSGLRAEFFANPNLDFSGKPVISRLEDGVNIFELPTMSALPANRAWSTRWSGTITPALGGVQKLTLAGSGTARLIVAGKLVGEFRNADFADTVYGNIAMEAGKPVDVQVEWTPRVTYRTQATDSLGTTIGPAIRLGWSGPDDLISEAAATAAKADVAIIFVGHGVGEGMDRMSLALPNDQDALIEAVAKANPRTVVILQTGGAVTMPWLDKVAGVLETWLPGDAIGPASSAMLFGDTAPGGRLPVTFPRDEAQGPARKVTEYPGSLDATGAIDRAQFSEGLLVGYRYWDAKEQVPLFPFGYGLSYTQFVIGKGTALMQHDGSAVVTVPVRNTGKSAGTEVVQVYLGFPAGSSEPPRQLKGFAKIALKPGEARTVSITLPSEAFRQWDETRHQWAVMGGVYTTMVGASSRDIAFTVPLRVIAR